MLYGYRMVVSVSVVSPPDCLADWELWLSAQHHNWECITKLGKDHNSKFKVWVLLNGYHFCTIKAKKNHKLNHCKLGTACAIYAISSVVALQWASLVAQRLKCLPAMRETWVWSLGWEDSPGEGNGNPLQYSHGWRRLVGCSPWGRKESDTTERLHFTSSLESSSVSSPTLLVSKLL